MDKPIVRSGGSIMGSKGVEPGAKDRYPQQHVRPGRGVPGYQGDVEVYPTPRPASFEGDGGTATLKAKEEGWASKKADDLRAELESRGLPTNGNKGDLIARLEDSDLSMSTPTA
jgi:hypothetical protein